MTTLVFDLETDGLLPELTKIHTLTICDNNKNIFTRYDKTDVPKGLKRLQEAESICGHNIIDFDIPAIKKVLPTWEFHGEVIDTLVWARLLYGDIKNIDYGLWRKGMLPGQMIGRHSLESWGYRLGENKGDFGKTTDWQHWTPEMSEYCEQDVKVTCKLLNKLEAETPADMRTEAVPLEHDVMRIISRQMKHGVYFDVEKAEALYADLLKKKLVLFEKLYEVFPKTLFVREGTKDFVPKRDNKTRGYIAGAACCKIKEVDFKPGSNWHVFKVLKKKYGWEPEVWCDDGSPSITEEVLKSLPYPEATIMAEIGMLDKRLGMLYDGNEGWLKHYNKNTHRLYGYVNPNGAFTGRMTHSKPNLGQIPANRSPYGKECRECFTVPKGKKLVGCDAEGIELRSLAHYLARWDKGEYADAVVEGKKEDATDAHSMNMKALEINSRDDAKTWFYAWVYGAGNATLGVYLKVGPRVAKKKAEAFLKNIPALGNLKDAVAQKITKQKYIKGLDCRRLYTRSAHSALNTLLQSAGAVIMKRALVIADSDLQAEGLIPGQQYEFVLNIHDEYQCEVDEAYTERVGEILADAIRKAGEYYNFKCKLAGEYAVGNTWKETH